MYCWMDIIGYIIIQYYFYFVIHSHQYSIYHGPWWPLVGLWSTICEHMLVDDPHYRWTGLKQSGKTWICHPFTGVWGMVFFFELSWYSGMWHTNVNKFVITYIHICLHICMSNYILTIFIYVYIYMSIYMSIYIYTYVHMYIYIFLSISFSLMFFCWCVYVDIHVLYIYIFKEILWSLSAEPIPKHQPKAPDHQWLNQWQKVYQVQGEPGMLFCWPIHFFYSAQVAQLAHPSSHDQHANWWKSAPPRWNTSIATRAWHVWAPLWRLLRLDDLRRWGMWEPQWVCAMCAVLRGSKLCSMV